MFDYNDYADVGCHCLDQQCGTKVRYGRGFFGIEVLVWFSNQRIYGLGTLSILERSDIPIRRIKAGSTIIQHSTKHSGARKTHLHLPSSLLDNDITSSSKRHTHP
jgi:hypothetical protein